MVLRFRRICRSALAEPELGKDLVVVLAKQGRARVDAGSAMSEGKRGERHAECTVDSGGGRVAMDNTAGRQLLVGKRFSHGPHPRGGNVARLQEFLPFGSAAAF